MSETLNPGDSHAHEVRDARFTADLVNYEVAGFDRCAVVYDPVPTTLDYLSSNPARPFDGSARRADAAFMAAAEIHGPDALAVAPASGAIALAAHQGSTSDTMVVLARQGSNLDTRGIVTS